LLLAPFDIDMPMIAKLQSNKASEARSQPICIWRVDV